MHEMNINFKAIHFRQVQVSENDVVLLIGRALKKLSPTTWQRF